MTNTPRHIGLVLQVVAERVYRVMVDRELRVEGNAHSTPVGCSKPGSGGSQMILTYDDALAAISEGETDWETLTQRVGRNDLPAILSEVAWSMTTTDLAAALRDAWVSAEHPEDYLDREEWIDMFEWVGYRHNLERVTPPAEIILYRGGLKADRMAWTADRSLAEWFRDRCDGNLWTATAHSGDLLAYYDGVRTGDRTGLGETEFVVNPAGLKFESS